MSSLDLTRDWLKNVLRPYPGHERVLSEVLGVLGSYRTLQVKTDAFSELATPPFPLHPSSHSPPHRRELCMSGISS